MTKLTYGIAGCAAAAVLLAVAGYLATLYGRPPMPVPFGRLVWDYETAFTVTGVSRKPEGRNELYAVRIRVVCPYGERYRWNARSAHVVDNSGTAYTAVTATPPHRILGAAENESMTFRLPKDIEQPALVFDDAAGFATLFDELRVGRLYERHRFNLRYD